MQPTTQKNRFLHPLIGVGYGLLFVALYSLKQSLKAFESYNSLEVALYYSLVFCSLGFLIFLHASKLTISRWKAFLLGTGYGISLCFADIWAGYHVFDNQWSGLGILFLPIYILIIGLGCVAIVSSKKPTKRVVVAFIFLTLIYSWYAFMTAGA